MSRAEKEILLWPSDCPYGVGIGIFGGTQIGFAAAPDVLLWAVTGCCLDQAVRRSDKIWGCHSCAAIIRAGGHEIDCGHRLSRTKAPSGYATAREWIARWTGHRYEDLKLTVEWE